MVKSRKFIKKQDLIKKDYYGKGEHINLYHISKIWYKESMNLIKDSKLVNISCCLEDGNTSSSAKTLGLWQICLMNECHDKYLMFYSKKRPNLKKYEQLLYRGDAG